MSPPPRCSPSDLICPNNNAVTHPLLTASLERCTYPGNLKFGKVNSHYSVVEKVKTMSIEKESTTVLGKNKAFFLIHNAHNTQPIVHPHGWAMGCLLWVFCDSVSSISGPCSTIVLAVQCAFYQYTPAQWSCGGYIGFTPSVCPSVCLSHMLCPLCGSLPILGWVGLWGFLWWAPSAKRKDHHGVSFGWSSVWHRSNTGLSSTQYEQIPITLGVWPFWLTPFFFRSITFWRAYG